MQTDLKSWAESHEDLKHQEGAGGIIHNFVTRVKKEWFLVSLKTFKEFV